MNFYSDEDEWKWLFRNAIDWDSIIPLYCKEFPTEEGFENKDDYINYLEELYSAIGKWCGENLSKRSRDLDVQGAGEVIDGRTVIGPILKQNYKEALELDFFKISAPKEYDGLGTPFSLMMSSFAQISRACLATSCQINFFPSIIDMIDRFCNEKERTRLIPEVISGNLSGSMLLTEPEAGSDLGNLKTTATKIDGDRYKINGTKIFITNAGGGIGFVLARTKGAPKGLGGISLFLVEQVIDEKTLNYRVTKKEDKMGLAGTFTCEVVFEDSIGHLIGRENEGFQSMLHLMNQSRIGVGLQAIGGIEAAISYVKKYSNEREVFEKKLKDLPLYARNLKTMEIEQDAVRALIVDTISFFDIYRTLDLKRKRIGDLNEDESLLFEKSKSMMRKRTPLVKYYSSELYVEISKKCMQSIGSYGYMKDYDVERYHRESFGPLMYEGTSQIQSLMAFKDLMKEIFVNPKSFISYFTKNNFSLDNFKDSNTSAKKYKKLNSEFYFNLGSLVIKTIKSDIEISNVDSLKRIFKNDILNEKRVNQLIVFSESITQSLSYLETLAVLSEHADKDSKRINLFNNYYKLVRPKLKCIYEEWKQGAYEVI